MSFETDDNNRYQPEQQPTSDNPEIPLAFRPIFRTRKARVLAGVGIAACCAAWEFFTFAATADSTPNVPAVIIAPDNQLQHTRNMFDGQDMILPAGTEVAVMCKLPGHGFRIAIESGEYSDQVVQDIPREHLFATGDPFNADHAPGGPEDRLAPVLHC